MVTVEQNTIKFVVYKMSSTVNRNLVEIHHEQIPENSGASRRKFTRSKYDEGSDGETHVPYYLILS